MPFLGGQPKLLIDAAETPVDWSPDGRQLAFVRIDRAAGASHIVIADADGNQQRILVTVQRPVLILSQGTGPVWSPDCLVIAFAAVDQPGASTAQQIHFVSASSGALLTTVPVPAAGVQQSLAWLSGDTLVVNHRADTTMPRQLWRLSYPDGRISRMTNDVNDYQGVGLTAQRESLVTVRSETRRSLWVGDSSAKAGTEIVPLELEFGG